MFPKTWSFEEIISVLYLKTNWALFYTFYKLNWVMKTFKYRVQFYSTVGTVHPLPYYNLSVATKYLFMTRSCKKKETV